MTAQVPLDSSDYGCLDHDSYLNCAQVFPLPDLDYIKRQVSSNLNCIKDLITEQTKWELIGAVRRTPVISIEHKRRIFNALS